MTKKILLVTFALAGLALIIRAQDVVLKIVVVPIPLRNRRFAGISSHDGLLAAWSKGTPGGPSAQPLLDGWAEPGAAGGSQAASAEAAGWASPSGGPPFASIGVTSPAARAGCTPSVS